MSEQDQLQITRYLERRLEQAEYLLGVQAVNLEMLLKAAAREVDEPGSVDWEQILVDLTESQE